MSFTSVLSEDLTLLNTELDAVTVRHAFSQFPSGVVALTAKINGVKEALVASSFTVGVSLEPVLVSIAIQNSSRTWPRLSKAECIGVSVLAEGQDYLCRQMSSKEGDRFADVPLVYGGDLDANGPLYLADSAVWFETSIYNQFPAGDHTIVLLEVHSLEVQNGNTPVVFHNSQFKNLAR